ncbi:hypothetical protein [Stenotrophomonas maltophilia]|uniref:hypothetical protein n=1 Tax=Stenotrophomonas maltophilia TaxID=40324 RepID=UPI0022B7D553|nr:hypothetical protein [Stenotrophomonas maltophilia]MCZ7842121.1 hypothetical protein [Stenotrophomonas maltophilia]
MATQDPAAQAPPPDSPGGEGSQTIGSTDSTEFISRDTYRGIGTTLQGLAEGSPRSIGGNAFAALMSSAVNSLESELRLARHALQERNNTIDKLKDDLSDERVETSRLSQLVRSSRQTTTLSQLCMTAASILAGLAVDASKSNNTGQAQLLGVLAIALLAAGWIVPRFKGNSND